MAERKIHPVVKFLLEFGPLAIFFLTYRAYDDEGVVLFGESYAGVVAATIAFIPAILISLACSWAMTRALPRMAVVTAVVVVVFGGLTIWLNDATFIKMKPTIVNLIFASILFWSLTSERSALKYVMGELLPLTDEGWRGLSLRFAIFFLFMAGLNEAIWRTMSESFWVNFKTFGSPAITFAFMLSQAGFLQKHMKPEEPSEE
ncbi:MAG: septation protein A [Pseudomonadota bacterium]